ncbi:hypothetical protein ACL7TT_08035 [Microbulbifer sp. 2304DJ12-6]|uniref:hypothetical protein n=1 Tax=Microbulbifer sp. 2304DJ12-6 TaxID=3233340 RepID=UPI0039AF1971
MDTNIYNAPEADLGKDSTGEAEFYVVSKTKFLILYFGTCGIYSIYWFYRHWKEYKLTSGEKMLPVLRAIFSIFFTYPLFTTIQSRIEEAKLSYQWHPILMAVTYIVVALASYISDGLSVLTSEVSIFDFISLALMPIMALPLFSAQKAANLACGDRLGESNAKFTLLNFLWLLFGAVIWGMVFLGAYAALTKPSIG